MKLLESIILISAYSIIIITIFVSLICYKRNIEKKETIAFSVSLLLLVISMSIPTLLDNGSTDDTTNIFVLLSMSLLSLTTPLSILVERKHSFPDFWKKILWIVSIAVLIGTAIAHFIDKLGYMEYVVIAWLAVTVIGSMIFTWMTKPQVEYAHMEKINQVFSKVFLVLVPLVLWVNYVASEAPVDLEIGFTLPLVFILLSAYKLMDDLKRLSLINPQVTPKEQHFKNYSLSKREKEIATLLAQGMTYRQISESLFISVPTVKTHASNVYKKCKVSSRHELTILITS